MDFKTFFFGLSPSDRQDFAKAAGTSVGHLINVAYGNSSANPKLCVQIERLSSGAVKRQEMKSDWKEIWPELIPLGKRKKAAEFVGQALKQRTA